MQKLVLIIFSLLLFISCKETSSKSEDKVAVLVSNQVEYASGFSIKHFKGYSILEVNNPWPDASVSYRYLLVKDANTSLPDGNFNATISIPVKKMVVTSTTHIPSLEALNSESTLLGFPNTDYISSKKTRALIDSGLVKELGGTQDINVEVLINSAPDVVVGFGVDGPNKSMDLVEQAGIPVVFNGDWVEKHPLGKAEWIKFFGALLDKNEEANSYFKNITQEYQKAAALAQAQETRKTVLSGALYKDVWYLPKGGSWAAQFIKDANGSYIYADSEGTGSLSLNIESVLEKAADADVWIGPGQFSSRVQMQDANTVYTQFKAFKTNQVYTFTTKKGATGGVIYYELAPNRPDLVLKDLIKILHPSILPEYELEFFSSLD